MRKYKFMSTMAAGMMAVAVTMGSLSGVGTLRSVSVLAADATVTAVVVKGPDIVAPGGNADYTETIKYTGDNEPSVTWTVEGKKSNSTSISNGKLTVGSDETAEKLTVKATAGGASGTFEVIVGTGVRLEIDYETMTGTMYTNGDDKFLFLEVLKDEKGEKAGTSYCYEANKYGEVWGVDLSFIKLSKDAYVRVYGDENTEALKIYTIKQQPKKPSVKYKYASSTDFYSNFTSVTKDTAENYQWKTQYGTSWDAHFGYLEEQIDTLSVAGSTILVRELTLDKAGNVIAPPSAETKVKIAAIPKAPKVTTDYAKNSIKLPKNSVIRVPLFNGIPAEVADPTNTNNKIVEFTPFYYTVGSDKNALNPSPSDLAEALVDAYIKAYNEAQAKLSDSNKNKYKALTTEDTKGNDGQITAKSDRTNLLEEMAEGYSVVVRTEDGKKAPSQFTLLDIKAAPTIGFRQKNTGNESNPKWVDENVIAIMTEVQKKDNSGKPMVDNNGDPVMETVAGTDTLTFKYSKDEKKGYLLTLTPDVKTAGVVYSYSTDGGEKFKKLSKETVIQVSKLDAKKGVIVRTEGVKADAKKDIAGDWASNEITLPVGIGEVTVTADKTEITAGASSTINFTVEVKDVYGAAVKVDGEKVQWTVDPTSYTITANSNDKTKATVTCNPTAAGEFTAKVTYDGAEGTVKVTIKAKETT